MPERRHARAGRSPRASEVGVRGEPAPRVDRPRACDTLTAHDGRPGPSLVRAVLNGSAPGASRAGGGAMVKFINGPAVRAVGCRPI